MTTAHITFYNVGLNEKNLPFNFTRLNAILNAGVITKDGQPYILGLSDLALGQPFNIDAMTYKIIRNATYCKIISSDTRDDGNNNITVDSVRYCFINNFLQLANGNWAVSYTIDDWTSFYLSDTSPYNIQIDGFTERANVPLLVNGKINITTTPLTGLRDDKGFKKTFAVGLSYTQGQAESYKGLPAGYRCAVYFISTPKYNGVSSEALAHGTVTYYHNFVTGQDYFEEVPRANSNLYFMVFDNQGYNLPIIGKNSETSTDVTILAGGQYKIFDCNDSTIDKIMIFNFIPSSTQPRWSWGYDSLHNCIRVGGTTDNNLKPRLADIYYHTDGTYFKGLYLSNFNPTQNATLQPDGFTNGQSFIKATTIADYYTRSLYQSINEFRKIKVRYLTAEIEIPAEFYYNGSNFVVGVSGDGESVVLKYHCDNDDNLNPVINRDENAATGQNTNYFDLTAVADFKAYKNAKITGAAGIAATVVGSTVALGSSIATGNVAGVVGSLSGGITGVMGAVQKLQGLTPYKQSPANGDYTLTQMTGGAAIVQEITEELPKNKAAMIRYLEENGAAVEMPFDEYMANCQMEAFNALKMANVDVTGAPQQIARRIEEMLLNGVTLWTATDVGNKKVINYPINS